MKLCLILLSLGGLIGGVESVLEPELTPTPKAELAYSQSALLAMPSERGPDPESDVANALADAQSREDL